ncbi:sulfite exporter TauE/SafE family protein [Methylophilus sp. Leaf408]|uniref:sulfite exporter TauE/SafE family protein n=1 Tax=Methylophilus sp. Leaf408 TaxID=2876561 RepID=UPI001E2B787D|nr:sulfite exporter TauE/SafE family protein [Methylophilus sp. Leaf408]
MLASLLLTAFVMGLAGGPHCIAMCGAACGAMQTPSHVKSIPIRLVKTVPWSFYLGRMLGYGMLGALAAQSLRGLAWLSNQSQVFQPLWTFSHTLIFAWGFLLLVTGQQPQWAVQGAQKVWAWIKQHTRHARFNFLFTGMVWALLPCGLLYSAVMLASLQSQWLQGALVMMAFAIGSATVMAIAPVLWQSGQQALPTWFKETTGMRISGMMLVILSLIALWMDLIHHDKLWCQVL